MKYFQTLQFSILICSLNSRKEKRADLLRLLRNCIGEHYNETIDAIGYVIEKYIGKEVEIIVCTDDKQMSVGAKRNLLIKSASGKYLSFIDDDDMVSVDYIKLILAKTYLNPDVIVFNAIRYQNGELDRTVIYGKEYGRDYSVKQFHYRLPNHLMCVKTSIASLVKFADISFGEDADYAKRMLSYLGYQERIFDTLYEYWFEETGTETQRRK